MAIPLDELKMMTAWDAEPLLTEGELGEFLLTAAMPDTSGSTHTSEDWTPTYDLNAAARVAWMVKAARAAALVEAGPPESGIVTSKVFDNCRAMARLYAAKRSTSARIRTIYTS